MSLKAFHIFFITMASVVATGCSVWGFNAFGSPDSRLWQLWFAIGAAALAVSLMVYLRSFLKKMKGVSYL